MTTMNYEKKIDQKDKIIGNNFSPEKQGKFQEFFSLVVKEEFYPHIGENNVAYKAKKKEKENQLKSIRCYIIKKVNIQQIQNWEKPTSPFSRNPFKKIILK